MKYVKKIVTPILALILTKINTNFNVFSDHYKGYKYPLTVMFIHFITWLIGMLTILFFIKIMVQ
jgi:hypothetical protein